MVQSGIHIKSEQREWLKRKGIKISPIVRTLLSNIMKGRLETTIKEVLEESWNLK